MSQVQKELDEMIMKFANGEVDFESDSSDALFEAVASKANQQMKLPETKEEIDEFLESIPLFATAMPEEGKESDSFKAIKSLIDSVPGDKRAATFKDSGNNAFKLAVRLGEAKQNESAEERKRRLETRIAKYREAIKYYTSALQVAEDDKELISSIYSNRAQCNLALGNYGHVVSDCRWSLKMNPSNHKAYYRAASAMFKLHKLEGAFGLVYRALTTLDLKKGSPEVKQFHALGKQIVDVYKRTVVEERAKAEAKRELEAKKAAEKAVVDKAVAKRGLTIGAEQFRDISVQYQHKIYVDEKKVLHWPVVFLYPDYEQSDFIADFPETVKFSDMFKQMFPPYTNPLPWDKDGAYNAGSLEISVKVGEGESFAEDIVRIDSRNEGTKLTVQASSTLGHALTALAKKGHVIPGYPIFIIRPLPPSS